MLLARFRIKYIEMFGDLSLQCILHKITLRTFFCKLNCYCYHSWLSLSHQQKSMSFNRLSKESCLYCLWVLCWSHPYKFLSSALERWSWGAIWRVIRKTSATDCESYRGVCFLFIYNFSNQLILETDFTIKINIKKKDILTRLMVIFRFRSKKLACAYMQLWKG